MSDYTPTVSEVREAYQAAGEGIDFKRRFNERGDEFDTWLAHVQADARKEALREAADMFHARLPDGTGNGRAYNSHTVARMLRSLAEGDTE